MPPGALIEEADVQVRLHMPRKTSRPDPVTPPLSRPEPARPDTLTTADKCEAILRHILDKCNEKAETDPMGCVMGFGPDWGGNALTVWLEGQHTHVGYNGASWDDLINSLYNNLCKGVGLSWFSPNTSNTDIPVTGS